VKPKSMSASAVHAFEGCPARYVAESYRRTPNTSGSAASLGTSVHEALDRFQKLGLMTDPAATVAQLLDIYDTEYDKLFGHDQSRKAEGRELCVTWFDRTHPIEHTILSAEVKENFPIRVQWNGEQVVVPFNYIWDRCDELQPEPEQVIDVVDYKTIAIPLNAEQMREKVQVRCYGLAAQVKYPNAKRVWITYDMLRHGEPLGVSFTKDDNVETYRYLQGMLLRILETDANKPPETVNDECRWCIRKQVCTSLRKHADVGGVHAIDDPVVAAERRHKMENVKAALTSAIAELDGFLMKHLVNEDILEFDAGSVVVSAAAQMRRHIDPANVRRIVPEEVWNEYGDINLKMPAFDKMLKDDRLTDDQKAALKASISRQPTAPSIKTKTKRQDEDE
jgi:hypothetical protein